MRTGNQSSNHCALKGGFCTCMQMLQVYLKNDCGSDMGASALCSPHWKILGFSALENVQKSEMCNMTKEIL